MNKTRLTIVLFILFTSVTVSVLWGTSEKVAFSSEDTCSKARKDYIAAEQEWTSVNAEVTFMRQELERLRGLRWETKTTLSAIVDAWEILQKKGHLTDAQRMTLNARIPSGRGTINPDGTFTMTGPERTPLKLDETRDVLSRVMKETDSDIAKTEKELLDKEKESHGLSQKLTSLERAVEKECKAAGLPTPWEQGIPRVSAAEIYDRYVERERMREETVAARRYSDIERLWARRYYGYHYPYASHPFVSARGLLIELKSVDGGRTFRHCYPFWDPWEKQLILDELHKAAEEHQNFFEVGRLGSFRIINVCPDIHDCYRRLSP